LSEADFLGLLQTAARQAGKPAEAARGASRSSGYSVQIIARTGAAPDHPVAADCPETEYLKAVWMRVNRSKPI
jgi:23S rRNA (cytosine1962-C5)-methyltransferase